MDGFGSPRRGRRRRPALIAPVAADRVPAARGARNASEPGVKQPGAGGGSRGRAGSRSGQGDHEPPPVLLLANGSVRPALDEVEGTPSGRHEPGSTSLYCLKYQFRDASGRSTSGRTEPSVRSSGGYRGGHGPDGGVTRARSTAWMIVPGRRAVARCRRRLVHAVDGDRYRPRGERCVGTRRCPCPRPRRRQSARPCPAENAAASASSHRTTGPTAAPARRRLTMR